LLDVFEAGTTTRVSVYSNAALTVELPNPVVANSLGAFPPVYFDDAQPIRVRVREADGSLIPGGDFDPYITDFADVEAAADAAAASAAAAAVQRELAEDAVADAEAQVALANAAAVIAQAVTGPIYANTTLGLAATSSGDEFAVTDANPALLDIFLNSSGTAVLQRTIIIDPTANVAASLIGTSSGDSVQEVLDAIGGTATIDLATGVTGVLPIANGGTGGSTASAARTALSAAASGANTDITALDQDVTITATGTIAANSIGFRGLPQNAQTGAYPLVLGDAGRHISITTGGVAIPANGTTAFPIGTAIAIYNNSGASQSITITSDTLRLAGTATTGTRLLLQRGVAMLVKVAATEWVCSGNVT
jgi:hypothetical protein